jgi:hypothetical protein
MAVGLFLSLLGVGGLCFLLVRSTVYALPVFAGFAAGFWAFDTGAGPLGAIGFGAVIGGATFAIFQVTFGLARSGAARALVAFVFAAPAAYAGYHVVFGLAQYGISSDVWRHVFAAAGAAVIGFAAVARLTDPVRWISEPASLPEPCPGQNLRD